jgi:TrmH family RNA methyltransferase
MHGMKKICFTCSHGKTNMTNNTIKQIQSLEREKYRRKHSQFFIEGKRLVESALEFGAKMENVYYTDSFNNENALFIQKIEKAGFTLEQILTKQLEKISFTQSPAGIAAVCNFPHIGNPDVNQKKWLYLYQVSDPGNMGTLFRSAAWFGFTHIALSPDCVDPFNPKVVRAGMGAHFGLSIHSNIELNLFADSHTLIGADHRGNNMSDFKSPENFVLILGSEAHGLSKDIQSMVDQTISIEKTGFGESLNVAVAGAILMEKLS